MPQVHHDLAGILEIVHFFFKARQFGISQIKRYADDGFARGAAPLVREIAFRAKFFQPFAIEFAIKLLNKTLQRRAFQPKPEITDGLG